MTDRIEFDALAYVDQFALDQAEALVRSEVRGRPEQASIQFLDKRPELLFLVDSAGEGRQMEALDLSRFKSEKMDTFKQSVDNIYAQIGYQSNRSLNLDMMLKFGENAWKTHNYKLQGYLDQIKRENDKLQLEINQINDSRKQEQSFAARELESIQQKQAQLLDQIQQIRMAIQLERAS